MDVIAATDPLHDSFALRAPSCFLVLTPSLKLVVFFLVGFAAWRAPMVCLLALRTRLCLACRACGLALFDGCRIDEGGARWNTTVGLVLGVIFGLLGKEKRRHVSTDDRVHRR